VGSSDRPQTRSHATPISQMSVTAFFDYLHEHDATTNLSRALGEIVMLRTCGARCDAAPNAERLAS
jgi:hypothetical protein